MRACKKCIARPQEVSIGVKNPTLEWTDQNYTLATRGLLILKYVTFLIGYIIHKFFYSRDGPLEKLWEGVGNFSSCTNFFVNISLAGIFFPYARTFLLG